MTFRTMGTAFLAAAQITVAWAQQPAPHSEHAKPEPAKAAAKPAQAAAPTPATRSYGSAFEGYRPFTDEPLKDWRRANAEVRDAGGHVGLMKGEPAQLTGHGSHGAKQPSPGAKR